MNLYPQKHQNLVCTLITVRLIKTPNLPSLIFHFRTTDRPSSIAMRLFLCFPRARLHYFLSHSVTDNSADNAKRGETKTSNNYNRSDPPYGEHCVCFQPGSFCCFHGEVSLVLCDFSNSLPLFVIEKYVFDV